MISMGYAPALVNLDISDVANPKLIGKLQFSRRSAAPRSRWHSGAADVDRNLAFVIRRRARSAAPRRSISPRCRQQDPAQPAAVAVSAARPPPGAFLTRIFAKRAALRSA